MRKKRNDIVLFANRLAGFSFNQWARVDLAAMKRGIREYILTEIMDLEPLVANLGTEARLVAIYGGDGTIFQILNFLEKAGRLKAGAPPLGIAPIGGGTMKRLPRFARWTGEPAENLKKAIDFLDRYPAYVDIPLLAAEWDNRRYVGVTLVLGPVVRIMMEYSRFKTTPVLAAGFSAAALLAGLLDWPDYFIRLYRPFAAEIEVDGRKLPEKQSICVLADVLETAIFNISPYRLRRGKDQFHCLNYAVGHKQIVYNFPALAVGRPPASPEYFNQPAKELSVLPEEELALTIDGEFFTLPAGTPLKVALGPTVRILVNPTLSLPWLDRAVAAGEKIFDLRKFFVPVKRG